MKRCKSPERKLRAFACGLKLKEGGTEKENAV